MQCMHYWARKVLGSPDPAVGIVEGNLEAVNTIKHMLCSTSNNIISIRIRCAEMFQVDVTHTVHFKRGRNIIHTYFTQK